MCHSILTTDGFSELKERLIHLHVTDSCVCCNIDSRVYSRIRKPGGFFYRIARILLKF